MQTSGFAELTDFEAPAHERTKHASPGLLGLDPAVFCRRVGGRVQQAVTLMAAPVTYRTVAARADDPRQVAHERRLHWGVNS